MPGTWHGPEVDATLPPELAHRFEASKVLGRGAFGVVVRARDRDLGRAVAIKLLHGALPAEAHTRFAHEAALLAQLRHPAVVEVYDHGQTSAGPYLVMELLEGTTWDEAPPPDLAAAALEVAGALDAVHAAGVLHRDLKPSNLVCAADGRVVVLDFGLARQLDRETMTRTGAMVGTAPYLAPELWRGQLPGPPADWYALGATLFRILEGHPPHSLALLAAHGSGSELLPPSFRAATDDHPARRLAEALLDPDPASRPAGQRALRRVLQGPREPRRPAPDRAVVAPTSSRGPAPTKPGRAGSGRGRVGWLVGLGLVLLVGAFLGAAPEAAPTTPTATAPASQGGPAAEALEALEHATAAVAEGHVRADGGFDVGRRGDAPGHHLGARMREVADPRYPVRYGRWLRALGTWLEAVPPEEGDAYLASRVIPLLDHLAGDTMAWAWYHFQPQAYGSEDPEILHERVLTKEEQDQRRAELIEARTRFLARLEGQMDRPLVAQVAGYLASGQDLEWCLRTTRRLIQHVRDARSDAEAVALARGLVVLGPSSGGDGAPFTCEDRRELAEALAGAAARPGGELRHRGQVAADALFRRFQYFNACLRDLPEEEAQAFEALVAEVERLAEVAPGSVLLQVEAILIFHRAGGFLLSNFGPGYERLIDRLEALATRVDTRLRGRPRGWPPGRPPTSAVGGATPGL